MATPTPLCTVCTTLHTAELVSAHALLLWFLFSQKTPSESPFSHCFNAERPGGSASCLAVLKRGDPTSVRGSPEAGALRTDRGEHLRGLRCGQRRRWHLAERRDPRARRFPGLCSDRSPTVQRGSGPFQVPRRPSFCLPGENKGEDGEAVRPKAPLRTPIPVQSALTSASPPCAGRAAAGGCPHSRVRPARPSSAWGTADEL